MTPMMRGPRKLVIAASVVIIIVLLMFLNIPRRITINERKLQDICASTTWVSDGSYLEKIRTLALNNTIMISVVDAGYSDMAINLYLTSIKPFRITNYIFLAIDDVTCAELGVYEINCAMYFNFDLKKGASRYGTADFKRKMEPRAELLLRVLCLGFTVLHVDADLFFYSNPWLDITCAKDCHMAALQDTYEYNAGFILLHANKYSVYMYQRMRELTGINPDQREQHRLAAVINELLTDPNFRIQGLSVEKYMYGKLFYANRKYYDTAPKCPKCIVVHNNWIVGKNEKILRAKEMLQWMVDRDGYYSSTTNKYLMYPNLKPGSREEDQLRLLKAALGVGHVLNRIVILPKFYCGTEECTLLELTSITELDAVFGGAYREHAFVFHPLVPDALKQTLRQYASTTSSVTSSATSSVTSLPRHVTDTWISRHFSQNNATVLVLDAMCEEIEFTDDVTHRLQRIQIKKKPTRSFFFW